MTPLALIQLIGDWQFARLEYERSPSLPNADRLTRADLALSQRLQELPERAACYRGVVYRCRWPGRVTAEPVAMLEDVA